MDTLLISQRIIRAIDTGGDCAASAIVRASLLGVKDMEVSKPEPYKRFKLSLLDQVSRCIQMGKILTALEIIKHVVGCSSTQAAVLVIRRATFMATPRHISNLLSHDLLDDDGRYEVKKILLNSNNPDMHQLANHSTLNRF